MDVSEMTEKVRSELTCSICLDLFTQPVTLDCGHSFCRECVLRSWQEAQVPWTCPLCRASSQPRALEPTQVLEALASSMSRQLRLPRDVGGQARCGQHQAVQKLFCEDDFSPLCVSCLLPQEHEGHRVYPLEESAETCKAQLQEALGQAWDKAREAHMLLEQERERRLRCRREAATLKRVILPEYIKTHLVWTEDQQQDLLDKEKRRNVKRLWTSEARISKYVQSLRKLIEELDKTLEQPLVEMLLAGRSTLERSRELLLRCPEPAALSWTLCGTTGMRELLLAFQSHILLDPGTAHSYLSISGDLKSVRLASHWWDLLDNQQEEVERLVCVLGAQSFTSGSHYWEVEVGSKTEWEVGICTGPGNNQGSTHGDVLSLSCLNMGEQFELWISHTMEDPEDTGPLHRLGIFLQYEGGHLSFYNVTQGCLIYAFPPVTFQGPLRPFFSLGLLQEENQPIPLTICPLSPHP
ncbi:probable E3 ubiquitin-protein ligase TRIML1 [Monodelphis domestica]|uniref:probable E3 ubiquitin-protein ligase TRIML1 n=1 Tax=Monodelphis domestica TaxID=13616 RepID=UPI0024E1D397|nr:probable E3 ubiquitin-protein ligase TRIML1 [Monodelphis domestica]XP_056673637.1 probable E3 ubiquitin-protein ligase TRIML1 [Monodelphis domestica]